MNMKPSMKAVIKDIRISADCLSAFAVSAVFEGNSPAHRAEMLEAMQTAISNLTHYRAELQRQLNVEGGK
ncbi:MAG: hypothetical protein BWK73_35950 [Thiothrix lacustris]|uniref:Uncharacterized protein n=1 Tax=Thiothrix lacustris TaxID=525917 RepID=A0A1Y1QFP1_9GAMM|nr:MAG: hypothetical protein BWK73_35950 [Thiothrix lacustris]